MESLKRCRHRKGWSLAQVASRAGLHPVSLARAERRGQDIRVSTLVAVAQALGVSPGELIEDEQHHATKR